MTETGWQFVRETFPARFLRRYHRLFFMRPRKVEATETENDGSHLIDHCQVRVLSLSRSCMGKAAPKMTRIPDIKGETSRFYSVSRKGEAYN